MLTKFNAIRLAVLTVIVALFVVVLAFLDNERFDTEMSQQATVQRLLLLRRIALAYESMPAAESLLSDPYTSESETNGDFLNNSRDESVEPYLYQLRVAERDLSPRLVLFVNQFDSPEKELVREYFSESDLPVLLYLLMERRSRSLWDNLVPIVQYMDNPELTVPVLIDLIERDDAYARDEIVEIGAKTDAVRALGVLGGAEAENYLRKVLYRPGAEEAAANWRNNSLPEPYGSQYDVIIDIQRGAALGLSETRKPENMALVEEMYREMLPRGKEIHAKKRSERSLREQDEVHLFNSLVEALINRDIYERYGDGLTSDTMPWDEIMEINERYTSGIAVLNSSN